MSKVRKYLRFTVFDRIDHWSQMASFTTLGLTGLVQKFASSNLSIGIITMLGGIDNVRVIHRVAATVMMLGVVYHLGAVGYKIFVQRGLPAMLPSMDDVRAVWQTILYNLGRQKTKPQQGRYTFDEKFEYWAFVWGTIIMGITGFMLWNPIATARVFPGDVIPASKAAHSGEALLAVLAIMVWHLYHVHIKHFNKSMFTGYLTEHEMLEEHPLELADLKAGMTGRPPDPRLVAQRSKVFFPLYGIAAALMLTGVFFFVTFEETAITTIPPAAEQVVVFAPLTPTPLPTPLPTPTPLPPSAATWESGIGALLQERCGECHSADVIILGGLNLGKYQGALTGGATGAAVTPNNPENSRLVIVQSSGDHAGQLSGEELAIIREWIEAGAPEK